MNLYDILYSLQKFLAEQTGVRTDIIYDGYEYPKDKPFMTLKTLMDERIYNVKRREAVQSIEHIQLSYHAEHFADRTQIGRASCRERVAVAGSEGSLERKRSSVGVRDIVCST